MGLCRGRRIRFWVNPETLFDFAGLTWEMPVGGGS